MSEYEIKTLYCSNRWHYQTSLLPNFSFLFLAVCFSLLLGFGSFDMFPTKLCLFAFFSFFDKLESPFWSLTDFTEVTVQGPFFSSDFCFAASFFNFDLFFSFALLGLSLSSNNIEEISIALFEFADFFTFFLSLDFSRFFALSRLVSGPEVLINSNFFF